VFVVDGRAAIVEEARAEAQSLREYLRVQAAALLSTPGFVDALPGLPDAASQARITIVLARLQELAGL